MPRATPTLNVLQRVGGSIGTAMLAVVLQREITAHVGAPGAGGGLEAARSVSGAARERVAEPLAAAFGATYWWAMAITALALIPAAALAVIEHRAAHAEEAVPTPPPRPDRRPAPDHARAPLG